LTIGIGNAKLAGFEKDLNLAGYDYNRVLTVFYVSYIVFEIPASLCCKWMGPGWFLPATTLGFGIMTIVMAVAKDIHALYAIRFLLGVFEAGMLPGIAYYLSRWYRRNELTYRLAVYMVGTPLAGAFGGLLASAILKLDSFGSLKRWRMIFAIEGIITVILALVGFVVVTDRPATARWLTQEQKDLAIARVKSERLGSTEVVDKFDRNKVLRGMFSPCTLSIGVVFLFAGVTAQGIAIFLPTIIATIYPDRTVVQKQLYTVPPYIVGAFTSLALPYASYKKGNRQLFFIIAVIPVIAGYAMFRGTDVGNTSVRYGASFLVASGIFCLGSMVNAQVSANAVSDTAKASAIGMDTFLGNIGGLISTWSYLPHDAPAFRIGSTINLSTAVGILVVSICLWLWMRFDNGKRDKRNANSELDGLSQQEIQGLEWKHPHFRWRP